MVTKKEPCLVPAGQGFSVVYNNKFLFSKYDPQRALKKIIDNLEVREKTLFLLCSPVLFFPIELLQQKLLQASHTIQKSCCILAVEHDKTLYDFSKKYINFTQEKKKIPVAYLFVKNSNSATSFIHTAQINNFFPKQGELRRIVKIDCSAAAQQDSLFYAKLLHYADDLIAVFWKNRVTISHLGKLFSSNLLKNVSLLDKSTPLIPHSIKKSILICGAGCSLDDIMNKLTLTFTLKSAKINHATSNNIHPLKRENLYIIAVDVTVIPLLKRGIIPDAIISMESQLAIEQSYVGMLDLLEKCKSENKIPGNPNQIHYICDISSRNAVARKFCNLHFTISFFMSQYCDEPFMTRVAQTKIVSPLIQPLGSVGLAAVEIATFLRAKETCIYLMGLDFSYPAGITHCKETPAVLKSFYTQTRLRPLGFPSTAYKKGARQITNTYFTDAALASYGQLFVEHFSSTKNIYNLSSNGYPLNIPFVHFYNIQNTNFEKETNKIIFSVKNVDNIAQRFYADEKERLVLIKKILTGKIPCKTDKLLTLIDESSYLYFHFPDGYKKARNEQGFLNRVRAGIDYYLKICDKIN
ncbi:MAG: hypothetical protein BKP49_04440 [Treponema sp. CETP13]|nr:MAG: hypothetical protein BKP49_04440 [Treponema sp. CETP13]